MAVGAMVGRVGEGSGVNEGFGVGVVAIGVGGSVGPGNVGAGAAVGSATTGVCVAGGVGSAPHAMSSETKATVMATVRGSRAALRRKGDINGKFIGMKAVSPSGGNGFSQS